MPRIIVIGGGISGLACARGLADRITDAEITVLEAGRRTGGPIHSETVDGFCCEDGPCGFLNRDPSTLALAVRLGLEDEILTGREQVRRRFILSGGRLRRFPDSPATFASSDLLSVRARARLMLEPLVPPRRGRDEETVAAFARRRLGAEAARVLVDPLVFGIYAGDPERLSIQAALPQLAALERKRKSVVMSLLRARQRGGKTAPASIGRERLVSFGAGLGRLVDVAAESLGQRVRLRSPVLAVVRNGNSWRVVVGGPHATELEADVVISAAPATAAARYLAKASPSLAGACSGIRHAPAAMVALGFREADVPHPLDGFGYLVAGGEPGSVLGVYWSSSMFEGQRSPPGKILLQAILGGAREPNVCELSDEVLLDRTTMQLRHAMSITAAPVFSRIVRHRLGLPQYDVGHLGRVRTVTEAVAGLPGLFVTGNAFRGVGINACTADAVRVVDAVVRHVERLPARRVALARPA